MVRFCLHQPSFSVKRLRIRTTLQIKGVQLLIRIIHYSITLAKRQEHLICAHFSPFSAATLGQFLERSSPVFAKMLMVGLRPLFSFFRGFVIGVSRGSGIVIWVFFHHLQLCFDGTNLCINTRKEKRKEHYTSNPVQFSHLINLSKAL